MQSTIKTISKETAIKAATRWAQFLTTPGKMDAGDSKISAFAARESNRTRAELDVRPQQIQRFISHLASLFQGKESVTVGVDYEPDIDLLDALEQAGFDSSVAGALFPIKTVMWVHDGSITARIGYNGQAKAI